MPFNVLLRFLMENTTHILRRHRLNMHFLVMRAVKDAFLNKKRNMVISKG